LSGEKADQRVTVEESTGFSCARQDFDKAGSKRMGQQFKGRKQELMARAPSSPHLNNSKTASAAWT
jgi:hypothetical protein